MVQAGSGQVHEQEPASSARLEEEGLQSDSFKLNEPESIGLCPAAQRPVLPGPSAASALALGAIGSVEELEFSGRARRRRRFVGLDPAARPSGRGEEELAQLPALRDRFRSGRASEGAEPSAWRA